MVHSSAQLFTYQPFWKVDIIKEERLLVDEHGIIIAKICQFQNADDVYCVPGIGLICITFPCGKDRGKAAYCYGPVQRLEYQPMYGVQNLYTVRFLPGAFGRYFRIPVSELPSYGIPLIDLMPSLNAFVQRASASKDLTQFCSVIRHMLNYLSTCSRNNNMSSELTWLLSLNLLEHRGNIEIQSLAANAGFCRRHLQDIFLMNVGLSPKQLCGQIRFQSTLQDVMMSATSGSKLVDISLRNGYFDQSHFNREFKRYTGMCPSQFVDSIGAKNCSNMIKESKQ